MSQVLDFFSCTVQTEKLSDIFMLYMKMRGSLKGIIFHNSQCSHKFGVYLKYMPNIVESIKI